VLEPPRRDQDARGRGPRGAILTSTAKTCPLRLVVATPERAECGPDPERIQAALDDFDRELGNLRERFGPNSPAVASRLRVRTELLDGTGCAGSS
jgi:hypothetical protein